MKAAIVLDDWKLPIFRKRLTEAGYTYTDAGAFAGANTILHVETDEPLKLQKVVVACEAECKRTKK